MLSLLPRSATGQKLSVYTQLIHAPAATGPASATSSCSITGARACATRPCAKSLYCIRCGACLNACPVFREIGGHAYWQTAMRLSRPDRLGHLRRAAGLGTMRTLAQASSLCGACKEACPVDIDLPRLLTPRPCRARPSTGRDSSASPAQG